MNTITSKALKAVDLPGPDGSIWGEGQSLTLDIYSGILWLAIVAVGSFCAVNIARWAKGSKNPAQADEARTRAIGSGIALAVLGGFGTFTGLAQAIFVR